MRTVKAETEVLDQLIQLSTTQLDSLRNETARTLDPDLFLTRIVSETRTIYFVDVQGGQGGVYSSF